MSNMFNMSTPVCNHLFVDREKELGQTLDWITLAPGNLIITGDRGIGKTSLAWKAILDAQDHIKSTLIVSETVYPFFRDGFDTFLSELGKQITVMIWQRVTGKSFSEIFSEALDFDEKKIEAKDTRALRRIYNLLSASQLTAKTSKMSQIGGNLVIKAETQEGLEKGMSRTAITNFEFLAIVDELKEIASRHGYTRIVVIADEFNYLHPSQQGDFVRTFFQILNAHSIVFGLIGVDIDPWSIPGFNQCVHTFIPLGPFDSVQHVHNLVTAGLRACDDPKLTEFLSSDAICTEIFEDSKGKPRLIQKFCSLFLSEIELSKEAKHFELAFTKAKRLMLEDLFREQEMLRRMRG